MACHLNAFTCSASSLDYATRIRQDAQPHNVISQSKIIPPRTAISQKEKDIPMEKSLGSPNRNKGSNGRKTVKPCTRARNERHRDSFNLNLESDALMKNTKRIPLAVMGSDKRPRHVFMREEGQSPEVMFFSTANAANIKESDLQSQHEEQSIAPSKVQRLHQILSRKRCRFRYLKDTTRSQG